MKQRIRSLRALDFEVAARAALAVAIPLAFLLVIGRADWAPYASFGAMTALYGRGERYRLRVRTVTAGGIGMLAAIAFGMLMALVAAPLWMLTIGLVLVLVVGILVATTAGLFPPTPIFFVFAYVVCAQVPTPWHEAGVRLVLAVSAAMLAWLITMSGWALRRMADRADSAAFKALAREPRLRLGAWRDGEVWLTIGQNVVGALIAGCIGMLLGIGHPYWAVVAVVAVVPPPRAGHSISRSLHRIIGTALGVIVAGFILLPGPPPWAVLIVIVVGQFGAEILVGRMYGAALLFITPLALGVAHLASPVPVPQLLADRLIETAIGSVVGMAMVLAARAHGRRPRA